MLLGVKKLSTFCQDCGLTMITHDEHVFLLCDRCCMHSRCGPGDWSECDCYDCGASMIDNDHKCPNPEVHKLGIMV
jgi:hypothetical protein